jgi:hypothetical protein
MKQSFTYHSLFVLGALLFALLLTACDPGSNATTTSQSGSDQSMATPHITSNYQGNGYSINYADTWTKSSIGVGDDVYFRDSGSKYRWFHIRVENLNQFIGNDPAVVSEAVKFEYGEGSNCTQATPKTQTIGGIVWAQLQEACSIVGTTDTPSKVEIAGLATTKSQKHFIITYSTTPDVFDQFDRAIFQPMLQSFKFQ